MPAVVPVPNLSSGVPVGLPGEAYQPMGAYGLPGEGYLGQGFFPTAPSTTPAPAETPVNMPTKRTVYEGPRAHQVAKRRWEKQQINKWLGSQAAQRPTAPTPSAPSAPVNPNAGVPTPSVSSGYAPSSPTTGARVFVSGPSGPPTVLQGAPTPGPMYGPPSLPPQFRAGPGGVQTPQMGSTIMQALTGSRPAPPSATAQFASKIPRIGGTQLNPANIKPSGGAGAWLGRLRNASVPLGIGMSIYGAGNLLDSDALRAGGSATSLFGTAAALGGAGAGPATIIPAAGVASGELGGNAVTRQLGRVLNGENPDSMNPLLNYFATAVESADSLGIIPEFLREPMARGERGLGDIPIVQDLLNVGGGEDGGEGQTPRQVLPAELPDIMSSLGVSPEIQQTALSQMDQDMALYRVYAERGMPIPGDVDADGKPVVRDPSEIEGLVTARFLQSLPELIDMEREQQSALARAAMFQATMGDMMAPYQDSANALADSYGPMLAGIEGVAPELQGPLADYAAALAAQTRGTASAYGAMGMAVPATVGLEQYMARQEAMQNRLAAMQMQAEIDAMSGQQSADATEADILG